MKPKAKFYQVLISSELRTQGMRLLEHLIRKHLIFGGPVLSGPARFLWKNEIVEHDYAWILDLLYSFRRQSRVPGAPRGSIRRTGNVAGAAVQGRRRRACLRRVQRYPEPHDQLLG